MTFDNGPIPDRGRPGRPGAAQQPTTVRSRPRLTAAGGVAVALSAGLFGAVIDVVTGPGLRLTFAVFFVAGCVAAAVLVRRRDLLAAVVLPPLVYLAIALVASGIEISGAAGSWLTREALEASTSLIVHAPTLIVATLLAAAVAGLRALNPPQLHQGVPTARVSGHGAR